MKLFALTSLFALAAADFDAAAPSTLINMPPLDRELEYTKAEQRRTGLEKYVDFAKLNEVNANLLDVATMTRTENSAVFSATYRVENALSLAVHFDQFDLPEGGELYLVSNTGAMNGPYTHETKWREGNLMVNHMDGDSVTIQYTHPNSASRQPVIHVDKVAAKFLDFDMFYRNSRPCNIQAECINRTENRCTQNDPRATASIQCTRYGGQDNNPQWAGPDWGDQTRASVAMTNAFGSRFCSGSFINNVRGAPLVLTAAHCGVSSSTLVLHDFKDPSCTSTSNTNGLTDAKSMGNVQVLANSAESDVTVIEVGEATVADNIFLAGWDTMAPDRLEAVVGIHHPASSNMKVSHSDTTDGFGLVQGCWANSNPNNCRTLTHWHVDQWTEATTEGGSSGSPLYDQTTKRIIGQLHGGAAACPAFNRYDVYGGLFRSFTVSSVVDALASGDNSVTFMDGVNFS